MKKQLTIIIPTRPNLQNITQIFGCLQRQDYQDFQIFLLIDSYFTKKEFSEFESEINQIIKDNPNLQKKVSIFTNQNSTFKPQKNASATRNYGIRKANSKFIYLFDDDNIFDDNHLSKTFEIYQELSSKNTHQNYSKKYSTIHHTDFVLTWTLFYKKTSTIQNQGFKKYNYRYSRPMLNFLKSKKYDYIRMYSGNWLFWPSYIFQKNLYDENLDFVAEDLDCTYRITKSFPMIVHSDLKIYHMEREKTFLEHARVWNEFWAYRKAKHRIIFTNKNWSLRDKFSFYIFWLHWNNARLSAKIIIWGGSQRWKILKSFWNWVFDWLLWK